MPFNKKMKKHPFKHVQELIEFTSICSDADLLIYTEFIHKTTNISTTLSSPLLEMLKGRSAYGIYATVIIKKQCLKITSQRDGDDPPQSIEIPIICKERPAPRIEEYLDD